MMWNVDSGSVTRSSQKVASVFKASAAALSTSVALICAPAWAGEFTVNPISLDLGATVKSGVLIVRNDGAEVLGFQLTASEWTQDAEGKDQYDDSRDLIFFPKILSIEPGKEGVIRVGIKSPVVATEKTYRIFIEELPSPTSKQAEAAKGGSAQINVLIRFGAPIFIAPVKPQDSAEITNFAVGKAVVALSVKNTGNRHQRIQGIQLKGVDSFGKDVYALTLADRYLLAGVTKTYTATIPSDRCARLAGLTVEIKTDKAGATRTIDMTRAMCS